jgi:hypothetical protein
VTDLFNLEKSRTISDYNTLLKAKITSFLVNFRENYNRYPIKLVNKLVRHNSIKRVSKLIVNGVSIETSIVIKEIQKKYKQLYKKLNPRYFNPTIKAYKHDAIRVSETKEVKKVYETYCKQLDVEFKEMRQDLDFCISALKAINEEIKKGQKK